MCTSVQVLTLRIRVDVLIDKSQFHHEDDQQVVSEVVQAYGFCRGYYIFVLSVVLLNEPNARARCPW